MRCLFQGEINTGSLTGSAVRPDSAAVILNDACDDRESKSAAPLGGSTGGICPVKALEYVRECLGVNAGTIILYFNLYKVFLDTFSAEVGGDLKKIELIEALLFLSMIPLHGESIRHQMVMLGTGLEILNRVIDIKESV